MRPDATRIGVIGGGLGGLSAAALLSRRGFDVTLFERSATLGGKARTLRVEGLVFDAGPTLLTLPATVTGVLEAAGAVAPEWIALETQCSYRYADGRGFEAYADIERTAASVAAFSPHDASGVRTFYAEAERLYRAAGEPYLSAPFRGYLSYMRRSLSRIGPGLALKLLTTTLADLSAQHFRSEALQQFAGRFATYVGTSPYTASRALAMIAHVERAFGVHHVVGGMQAIVDALAAAAKRHGATIVTQATARSERRGEKFVIGEHEPFDALVVNEDPLAALGTNRPLALSGHVLLIACDVRAALPHHRVHFGSDYRREFAELMRGEPPSDPTLYLCHPAATDPGAAPAGESGIFAMINMPAAAPFSDAVLARVRERMLERLVACEPALRGHVRVVGERTPNDFLALGAPGGSIYGHLEQGAFGPFRRPRMQSRVPGMFYTGGGTHPGGGVPMVLSSGRFAADLVAEHCARRAPARLLAQGVSP